MGKLCLKPRRGYKLAQAVPVLSLWFFPASHEGEPDVVAYSRRIRGRRSALAACYCRHRVDRKFVLLHPPRYFIHLDLSLKPRPGLPAGVKGDEWQVRGHGFYHMMKYLVAPAQMPDSLT